MSCLDLIILGLIVSIIYVDGCTVGKLDLSFITEEILCEFDKTQTQAYELRYKPCGDDVECEIDLSLQMALQQESKIEAGVTNCWELAKNEDTPTIFEGEYHNEEAYVIQYSNGVGGRITDFRFFCDESSYDKDKTTCGEVEGSNPPEYYLEIYSSNACGVQPDENNTTSNSGLSGGWIFIICVCSVLLLYCIIGYSINAMRTKAWGDVTGNIPNIGMWKTLPKATIAGCIFTFGWCRGKCSKNTTNDLDDDFIDDE